jgi:CDP-4-dehydro-6-deoxyglucose reductase, E3
MNIPPRPKPQRFTATIESKVQLTTKVFLVNFKLQNPTEIAFLPGQTISLNVAPGVNRSMSISSVPSDNTHILMCHDVSPDGPGSQWTVGHDVGATATFMAPLGIFVLDPESHRKKVFVATGTGIAPFRSMLWHYLPNGGTDDITLYWGLRYEEDVYWIEEFEQLARQYPNFRFVLTLSKPPADWQGKEGRVTDHVIQEEANLPGSDFYLCGNQHMIKDMESQLTKAGVSEHQIYKELYF